jgi:hypothetical protein
MPSDPLVMGGLDPGNISAVIEEKSKARIKPPSELDLKKEERLAQKEQRLTASKERAAAASASGPSVTPDPIDISRLIDQITSYRERFPHLKSRNKISAKSAPEEIEDELHYIEIQLGSGKEKGLAATLFTGSMTALEAFTRDVYNPLNLKLTGLGQVARDNISEMQDVLDELSIKYGSGFYMQPETRLILGIGALIMTVHSANSGDSRVGEALKAMNRRANAPEDAHRL